jgi:PAS domain S-box-containing protein
LIARFSERLIGPWIDGRKVRTRYAFAVLCMLLVVCVRYLLVPSMGGDAPLLPLLAATFLIACVAGYGPALFAALSAAVVATMVFAWPDGGHATVGWIGHVTLFLVTSALIAGTTGAAQVASRRLRRALDLAYQGARQSAATERQLRLLTNHLPAMVGYVGSDFRYRFVNAAYQEHLGIRPPGPLGQHVREVLGEQGFEARQSDMHRALAGEVVTFETPLPTGRPDRVYAVTYVPNTQEPGDGFFVMALDITERAQAQSALREADRRKDEFLAMLAHELRNPLAPLMNVAQLLGQEEPPRPVLRTSAAILRRQVQHMSRLVDDLLDVARIRRGTLELQSQRCTLADLVDVAAEAVAPLFTARRQKLLRERGDEVVELDGDPVRLAQVFTNLLRNASTYSPPDTEVRLGARREDGVVVVDVLDQGRGIDADLLPMLFTPFAQAERSLARSEGGLGLGLVLVKSLVEKHGGSVAVASRGAGMGSVFTVRLPVAVGGDSAGEAPGRGDPPAALRDARPVASRARRILIVDDNADVADSLRTLLIHKGHVAESAPDGESALAAVERFRPEIVLLDIGLPDQDGYEVARRLRRRYAPDALTLVAITGYAQERDRARALESGFDAHYPKPVTGEQLDRLTGS